MLQSQDTDDQDGHGVRAKLLVDLSDQQKAELEEEGTDEESVG